MTLARIIMDFVDVDPVTGDFVYEKGIERAVEPGTIVSIDHVENDGSVWYAHPETGRAWASPPGLWEYENPQEVTTQW